MKKLILITGGQRSGKSKEAEAMALRLSKNPVYLATAHIWDEEFKERVRVADCNGQISRRKWR